MIKKYVVGFMFSEDLKFVALIRKQKPEWQRGKLNGIGGKVEAEEDDLQAIVREFKEETGSATKRNLWLRFAKLEGESDDEGSHFKVQCFASTGDLSLLKTTESEEIEIIHTSDINPHRNDLVENLRWMIPLAMDFLEDGRPLFCNVQYPVVTDHCSRQ